MQETGNGEPETVRIFPVPIPVACCLSPASRFFLRERAMKILTALLWALLVSSALILLYGASPAEVYGLMLARTWGDAYGLGQVVFRATPLVFTGLAVALAFHGGLFNIGAEGQLALGSLACALAGAAL